MLAYQIAINIAKENNQWFKHPNPKRKNQKVAFVEFLKNYWQSKQPENDVPLSAGVIWVTDTDQYAVFVTTDTGKTEKQIIMSYELRPEIEEDYRQLKEFWGLEKFKSTRFDVITFHIICVLFGYLFYQLYRLTAEGSQYIGKSMPVALKKYNVAVKGYIVLYAGNEFGIFSVMEFADLYASCDSEVKLKIFSVAESL